MISRFLIFAALVAVVVVPVSAQRRKPVQKPRNPQTVAPKPVEIAAADWKPLADALTAENWSLAAELAEKHISSLKSDNPKKQLAQLRYIRLFAIAGVIAGINSKGNVSDAEPFWNELDRLSVEYVGKEIVMPPREFADDCSKRLNFLCPVKESPNALRIAAVNLAADTIHSFDYIRFDGVAPRPTASSVMVGGMFERAEFNDDPAKPWIMRLFFTKGFVFESPKK